MTGEPPLVHRPVRTGGLLLAFASLQFLAVVAAVAMRDPAYGFAQSSLLSLGGAPAPWGWAFHGSIAALGLLAAAGLLLVWSAFDPRPTRGPAFLFLLVGAVATVAVGLLPMIPLALPTAATDVAAYAAVLGAVVGLALLSVAMQRAERWRASRPFTLVTAAVMACGAALLGTGIRLGLGSGTLDLLVVGPVLVWAIFEGGHIALLHRYAPGLLVKAVSA